MRYILKKWRISFWRQAPLLLAKQQPKKWVHNLLKLKKTRFLKIAKKSLFLAFFEKKGTEPCFKIAFFAIFSVFCQNEVVLGYFWGPKMTSF